MDLKTRDLTMIAMFASLTAVGAFIKIPLPIVPFTLQYFFCALGAMILGSKKGALSQSLTYRYTNFYARRRDTIYI